LTATELKLTKGQIRSKVKPKTENLHLDDPQYWLKVIDSPYSAPNLKFWILNSVDLRLRCDKTRLMLIGIRWLHNGISSRPVMKYRALTYDKHASHISW